MMKLICLRKIKFSKLPCVIKEMPAEVSWITCKGSLQTTLNRRGRRVWRLTCVWEANVTQKLIQHNRSLRLWQAMTAHQQWVVGAIQVTTEKGYEVSFQTTPKFCEHHVHLCSCIHLSWPPLEQLQGRTVWCTFSVMLQPYQLVSIWTAIISQDCPAFRK